MFFCHFYGIDLNINWELKLQIERSKFIYHFFLSGFKGIGLALQVFSCLKVLEDFFEGFFVVEGIE